MANSSDENEKILFKKVYQGETTVLGSKLKYPVAQSPEIEFWKVFLPPQSVGDWHEHLVPEFFYIDQGVLYVVNKQQDGQLKVVKFAKGQVGLTDINIPQFIWNPGNEETIVSAIYLGASGQQATRKLGGKPDKELLAKLLDQELTSNQTEINNKSK